MASRPPNIIFILIDDLGWKDLGCYGSQYYQTPHIDSLARDGMRFTDAYAACPVCSPTRASILTGKYPARIGITDWIDWMGHIHPARGSLIDAPYLKELPECEFSLASALGAGGYAAWHIGKWHLGGPGHLPEQHGFDVNVGGCHFGSPAGGGYFSPWTLPSLADVDVPEGTFLDDYLTDQAIDLIVNRDSDRPFYMNFCFYSVHTPIQAKAETVARYAQRAEEMGLADRTPFEEGEYFPCEHKKHLRVQRRLLQSDPTYAAMIDHLDSNVGRLLATLQHEGIADDTLVIFTSDNGGLATAEGSPTCNAPLAEGKGWMYDGGTREPLIVRWPGHIAPGTQCRTPVTSPDFYPTLLAAAGMPPRPGQDVDGVNIMPLLQGAEDLDREAIFWHYPHYGNQGGTPGSSVRAGDFKLIEFFEDGRLELYNLRTDISEKHNLAESDPATVTRLHGLLRAWRQEIEAKIPVRNPNWISA